MHLRTTSSSFDLEKRGSQSCVAVITGVPHQPQLSVLTIADNPFYIAMSIGDELSAYREVHLEQMHKRNWMLPGKHASAHLYDTIHFVGAERGAYPSDIDHFTSPEGSSELIREHHGLAVLPRSAAWRIARDGVTYPPLFVLVILPTTNGRLL
jgi:hypothetical protein